GERATPRTEAPASAPASVAGLHTLILQPGPLDGRDTFVSSVGLYRNDNFGPEQTLRVGLRPPQSGQAGEELSLLAFTLERLPPGCEVEAAELVLSCMNTLYSSEPAWVEARAVVPSGARTPWVEGTGCHDALVGGVVWDGTFAGLPDPRTHSARPELSRPDLAAEALDRVQVGEASPDHEREVRFDVTEAVRAWVSRPATNLGLGLTAPAGAPPGAGIRVFHSSESLRPERRPRLVVRYRGAPPLPAADEARALEQAARRVRALLPALVACALGGDWEQAFALGTRAVEEAPFLGEPFLARGLAAERLGFLALARLEVLRSVGCQQPTLVPEGYAALARLSLPLRNPQARIQGLGALTALACERRMEPEVARLYRVALAGDDPAGDRSDWGRHASAMLEILEASRRRLGSEDPALAALPLLVALVHAARADPGAPEAFARARAAWPRHPLSVGFPELPVGPRPAALGAPGPSADWARILVAVGALDAARAQVAQARAAWPDDAELEQLERCLGDR
ncbi:MAG: DNRLRE domain-containing protein, partial [Planctomycetes bacterium]|nr:DNRLRE domain-containing protein [Planctomycetota bacterium]